MLELGIQEKGGFFCHNNIGIFVEIRSVYPLWGILVEDVKKKGPDINCTVYKKYIKVCIHL